MSVPVNARVPEEGTVRFTNASEITVSGLTRPNVEVRLLQPGQADRAQISGNDGKYVFTRVPIEAEEAIYEVVTGDRVGDLTDGATDRKLGVEGFALPGALVTLSQASTSTTRQIRADATGRFLFEDVAFNEGPNQITLAVAADEAQPARVSFDFILDTTAPVVEFTGLQPGEVLDTEIVSVSGRLDEKGVTIEYTDPESGTPVSFVNTSRLFDIPFFSFPEGYHSLVIDFIDSVGNRTESILNFQVDRTDPPIVIVSPATARNFFTTVLEAPTGNRLAEIRGLTSPHALVEAELLTTGDTYFETADSDGSFKIPPFRDVFGNLVEYQPGEQIVRIVVRDAANRERDERVAIQIPKPCEQADCTFVSDSFGELTGDGTTTLFQVQAKALPIAPDTLFVLSEVSGGEISATDDGDGNLLGAGFDPPSQANYTSGALTLDFTAPPDAGASITASYLQVPPDGGLPLPLWLESPPAGASYSSSLFDQGVLKSLLTLGQLVPPLDVLVRSGPSHPYAPVNFSLDGRRVSEPERGIRIQRPDPVGAPDLLCLPGDPATAYLEIRNAPLGAEGLTDNILRIMDDPSCDGGVLPLGCLSLPDTRRFRALHVQRSITGACAAGFTEVALDASQSGADPADLPAAPWLVTDGAICAGPFLPCPAAVDLIDSITVHPDGFLDVVFNGASTADLSAAQDGLRIQAGDSVTVSVPGAFGDQTLTIAEVVSATRLRTEPFVTETVTRTGTSFAIRIDRNVEFTAADSLTDAAGNLIQGPCLGDALFSFVASDDPPCPNPGYVPQFSQLQGPLVASPEFRTSEVQALSFAVGEGGASTRIDSLFRVFNPERARVVLLRPADGSATAELEVAVEGYMFGDNEVEAVQINGRQVGLDSSGRFLLHRLPLVPGQLNQIQVVAVTSGGAIATAQASIFQLGAEVPDTDVTLNPGASGPIVSGSPAAANFLVTGTFSSNADVAGRVLASGIEGIDFDLTPGCGAASFSIFSDPPHFDLSLVQLAASGNPSILYVVDGPAAGTSATIDSQPIPGTFDFTPGQTLCAPGSRLLLIERNILIPDPVPPANLCPTLSWPCWNTAQKDSTTKSLVQRFDAIAHFDQDDDGLGPDIDDDICDPLDPARQGQLCLSTTFAAFQLNVPGAVDTDTVSTEIRTAPPFVLPTSPVRFSGSDGVLAAGGPVVTFTSLTNLFAIDVPPVDTGANPFPQFEDVVVRPGDLLAVASGPRAASADEIRYYEVVADADPLFPNELQVQSVDRQLVPDGALIVGSAGLSFSVYPRSLSVAVAGVPPDGPAETNQPILTNLEEIDVSGFTDTPDALVTVDNILPVLLPDGSFYARNVPLADGPNLLEIEVEDEALLVTKHRISVFSDPDPPVLSKFCLAIDSLQLLDNLADPCSQTGGPAPTVAPVPVSFLPFPDGTAFVSTKASSFELRGIATDGNGSGIRTVDFTIDGQSVGVYQGFTGLGDPFGGNGLFSHALALERGPNPLLIEVTDRAGNKRAVTLVINVDQDAPRPPTVVVDCLTDGFNPAVFTALNNNSPPLPLGSPPQPYCIHEASGDVNYSDPANPLTPVDLRSSSPPGTGAPPAFVPVEDRVIASSQATLTGRALTAGGEMPSLFIGGQGVLLDAPMVAHGTVEHDVAFPLTGKVGQTTITVSNAIAELCRPALEPILQVGDTLALGTLLPAQSSNVGLYEIVDVSNLCTLRQLVLDRELIVNAVDAPGGNGMTITYERTFRFEAVPVPEEGLNTLTLEAMDSEGNVRVVPFSFVRDTQPPSIVLQGVADGFETTVVSPDVLFTDPHLCTSEPVCPGGGGFDSAAPGAGAFSLQIRVSRRDENGETPAAAGPLVAGDAIRYGWALFSDDIVTAGVLDPVSTGYDLADVDGDGNPFTPLPPGYPDPDTALDPNNGTPRPPPVLDPNLGSANGIAQVVLGLASASFSPNLLSTPLPGDVSCTDTVTGPPNSRPCETREPLDYRIQALAFDRVGHGSASQVDFTLVANAEARFLGGAIGLISDNPFLLNLLSDSTDLQILLLDRLSESGVLFNQNLLLAEMIGDIDAPGPLASELISSGAREAFAVMLGILFTDPDAFGPADSAIAVILDVLRVLIDNGAADDLLPVLDNPFIIDTCTAGSFLCPTGPGIPGDGTRIFTFLSDVLVDRDDADKTDADGDSQYFRTAPGPIKHLLPLQQETLSREKAVRRRSLRLLPVGTPSVKLVDPTVAVNAACPAGGVQTTVELTARGPGELDFLPVPAVPRSPVNVQALDILRVRSGPCEGFSAEIVQVVDADTACIDGDTPFPATCGADLDFEILFPNGPALIPLIELLDGLLYDAAQVDLNNPLGDAGVLRSLAAVIEEIFGSGGTLPGWGASDLEALFHSLYELTDDGDPGTGTEFSDRLIEELDALFAEVPTPNAPLRNTSPRMETLLPLFNSILEGEAQDPVAFPYARPNFRPGLLQPPDWPLAPVDFTAGNPYAVDVTGPADPSEVRHVDFLQFALEVQSRANSSGERPLEEIIPLLRELVDDPDDYARGRTPAGGYSPPGTNPVFESALSDLSDPLARLLSNDIAVDLIDALSDILNPCHSSLGADPLCPGGVGGRSFNGDLVNYDEDFIPVIDSLAGNLIPIPPTPDPLNENAPLLRALALSAAQRLDTDLDGAPDSSSLRGLAEALRALTTPIGLPGQGEGLAPGYPEPSPPEAFVDSPICRESFFNGRTPLEVLVPIVDQLLEPLPVGPADDEDPLGRDRLTILLQGLFDDPHVDEPELPNGPGNAVDDCADPCFDESGVDIGNLPAGDGVAIETRATLEKLAEIANSLARFGFDSTDTLTSIFDTPFCAPPGDPCPFEDRLLPAQLLLVDLGLPLDGPFQIGSGPGIIQFNESLTHEVITQLATFDNGFDAANYLLLIASKIAEDIEPMNATTPVPPDTALAPAALRLLADPDGDGDPLPDGVVDDFLPIIRVISKTAVARQILDAMRALRACGVDAANGNEELRGGAVLRALHDSTLALLPALSGAQNAVPEVPQLTRGDLECPGEGAGGRGNSGGPFDENPFFASGQSLSPLGVLQGGSTGTGDGLGAFRDPGGDYLFNETLFASGAASDAGTLTFGAITPGSLILQGAGLTVLDDGAGNLTGAGLALAPPSTIDYVTGAYVINYSVTPAPGEPIDTTYSHVPGVGNPEGRDFRGLGVGPGAHLCIVSQISPIQEICSLITARPAVGNGQNILYSDGDLYSVGDGLGDPIDLYIQANCLDGTAFCPYRIRQMREPYNGCLRGEAIEMGEPIGSQISAANQSYLDFVLRGLRFLVTKDEGFIIESPIAPPPVVKGRLPHLLDLLVSPVPSSGGGGSTPLVLDIAPSVEGALRSMLSRYPFPLESPFETAARVLSASTVDLSGPAQQLPFDLYPTSTILYQGAPVPVTDERCPGGVFCQGNAINDAFDVSFLALNSVLDQLEIAEGQNGIPEDSASPANGDCTAIAPQCPTAYASAADPDYGYSDDPHLLLDYLSERLPIIADNLGPGLQILLEGFEGVSRGDSNALVCSDLDGNCGDLDGDCDDPAREFDPVYPPAAGCNEPRASTLNLVQAVERLAYQGSCRPRQGGANDGNCRVPNLVSPLAAPRPGAPNSFGLVFENVIDDGPLQILSQTSARMMNEWLVPPTDPATFPEGVLHRDRVIPQLYRPTGLPSVFQFLRDIVEDLTPPTSGQGRIIDPMVPIITRLSNRRFAGVGPPNSLDSESPYDVLLDLLFTMIEDTTDCDQDALLGAVGFQRSGIGAGASPFFCQTPALPPPYPPAGTANAGGGVNVFDSVFRDEGVNVERPIQPIFDADLFDQLLKLFDQSPDPDIIEEALPFQGALVLGLVADPVSCATQPFGACAPRTLQDHPTGDPFTIYHDDTILADALLADLQFLVPSGGGAGTCPPSTSPPFDPGTFPTFADRPYGDLCDPLVSDDLNRDGLVGGPPGVGVNLCGTDAVLVGGGVCVPRVGNGVHSTCETFDEADNDPDGTGTGTCDPPFVATQGGAGRPGDIGFAMQDGVATVFGVDGIDDALLDGLADVLADDDPAFVVDHENEGPSPIRNRFTVRAPGVTVSSDAVELLDALGELLLDTQLGN
ncbi:MAG: hypothetical protein AB1405_08380 [Bdellovibrionota bacterium]